jgi:hypothetical protein
MPIVMLQTTPGGTEEEYERMGEQIFGVRSDEFSATDAPDGLILHCAGATEDGWYVCDVWQTPEHMQAFMTERLMPALQALGVPPGTQPQVFETRNLVVPNRAAAH